MAKLIGVKKIRTAVFISGTGTNLKNLIKFSLSKNSPIDVKFVASNNKKAKGLDISKKYKIENKFFLFSKKQIAENQILKELKKRKIRLICLAGFMKILSKKFINKFQGKILNIHPSLLPKYKGLNTHERVIKNKEKYSGCTVHFVTSKVDSGRIIMQKKVILSKNETIFSLKKKVQKKEYEIYPKALKKILTNP